MFRLVFTPESIEASIGTEAVPRGLAEGLAVHRTSLRSSLLRGALRQLRYGIDRYKQFADSGLVPAGLATDGYPRALAELVTGVRSEKDGRMVTFLPSLPIDPTTGKADWVTHSYQDAPRAKTSGGKNVFDVGSASPGIDEVGVPFSSY